VTANVVRFFAASEWAKAERKTQTLNALPPPYPDELSGDNDAASPERLVVFWILEKQWRVVCSKRMSL